MWSIVQAAGWPIWPLIAASTVALALILERAIHLQDKKVMPENLLDQVLAHAHKPLNSDALQQLAQSSPLGTVLAGGLACKQRDRAHLQDAFEVAGRKAAAQLERYLPIISMIATVAPLLGLLGTVVGMIEIFASQGLSATGGADPQALARGISIALYNTAFGLIVAIPCAIAHRIYRVKVDNQLHALEDHARRLLDTLANKGAA